MLSIVLQIVEFVSFIAPLVLVWRVNKRPRWRIRAIIYGWAAFFLLSVFWCFLMPACFSGLHLPVETFPDGTIAMAALVFGWIWPAIIVGISSYLERRKRRDDHVA
jgi:membrane associated rhomboid family serine protease